MEKRTIELTDTQRGIIVDALVRENAELSKMARALNDRGIANSIEARHDEIKTIINIIADWWEE